MKRIESSINPELFPISGYEFIGKANNGNWIIVKHKPDDQIHISVPPSEGRKLMMKEGFK